LNAGAFENHKRVLTLTTDKVGRTSLCELTSY
jgi:hypothetical protein